MESISAECYSQPIAYFDAYFDKITIENSNKPLLKLISQWLKVRINVPCHVKMKNRREVSLFWLRSNPKPIKEAVQLVFPAPKKTDSTINLDFTAIKSIAFKLQVSVLKPPSPQKY